ncbi:MAG: UDP-N-acetylmuramoyl-L-alanyl-D-glutamate--2,6-diaminopimelate ligase [Oscillospiraceae bacterium]|nr:UDP-N-acetylmuramoyl-L-alanyl-D-glutamate--2,6-diaminopimelate ligase [Oscillospiraceae bacterium]
MIKTIKNFYDILNEKNLILESSIPNEILNREITCLTFDNREVDGPSIFVCKGAHFKEEYLISAISSGALLYVSEQEYDVDAAFIKVSDIRLSMVYLAEIFYENAPSKITSIGITGTKGKSTTAYYLRNILNLWLKAEGKPECAIISSIDTYDGVIREESHLTTPEAMPLHKNFYNAVNSGISHLVMEVSSQALKYNRVTDICFDVACFTNIGVDHISPIEHTDFEDYFSAKLKLFDTCKTACINTDAQYSDRVLEYAEGKCKIVTFGSMESNTIYCKNIEKKEDGLYFNVRTPEYEDEISITMPGIFNVSNALAAIAMSYVLGIPKEYVKEGLRTARAGGRMQVYGSKDKKIVVIVDYAHNAMSFEALYNSTRVEYPGRKIVTVFGCPGMKALLRRHDLGDSAGKNSDFVFITEEDSGEEPFMKIAKDIEENLGDCPHEILEDRGLSIFKAINEYADGEEKIILITGKGEETRQKRGTLYIDCPSDVEYTYEALKAYDEKHPV